MSRDCTLDLGVVAVAVANADSVVVVRNVAANADCMYADAAGVDDVCCCCRC